jgi:hypothetical protein
VEWEGYRYSIFKCNEKCTSKEKVQTEFKLRQTEFKLEFIGCCISSKKSLTLVGPRFGQGLTKMVRPRGPLTSGLTSGLTSYVLRYQVLASRKV